MSSTENKILKMYEVVYGKLQKNKSLYVELTQEVGENPDNFITVYEDGSLSHQLTLAELTFDYITKDWE